MEKRVLSFSFIVKALQMSSSKVAYHVSELQKREVLEKLGNRYVLTETYRSFLPYFDSLLDRKKYPLVVVKVDITMKGKHLLIFRKKEPFLGFWELPATKLKLGESIEGAAKRVLGKTCTRVKISAPLQLREQVVTNKEVVYDYFLYFVTIQLASSKDIKWEFFSKTDWNHLRLIPTDKLFLEGKLKKGEQITLQMEEDSLVLSP